MDKTGEVIEVTSKSVIVLFGNMITTVDIGKIQKTSENDTVITSGKVNSTGFIHELHKRKLNFKPEIDIRGQRGDEALQTVTNFIDEAIMVDEKEVRILHGKGDGILRQLVREWLQANDMVKKYHDEHVERGGTGITVVELDM